MSGGAPLLEMRAIVKTFPGVRALDGVSFDVRAGEVHALVGENGAGKSTLMKILAGAQRADSGEILVDGTPVTIDGPRSAENLGIGMIYQEFNLVPALDVVANVVLGDEPMRGPFLDRAAAEARVRAILADLDIDLPLDVPAGRLSVAQQQLVEIAKATGRNARVLVMDEPTAAISPRETAGLFALVRRLRERGVGIVYISHRLEELPQIADRITVVRDGRNVETRPIAAMPQSDMIRLMVGRTLERQFPALPPVPDGAPVALDVEGLVRAPAVNGVSLRVRRGEILGLAGLVGAGRSEIVRAIAGADLPDAGVVRIDGAPVRVRDPESAIAAGIALITDDRKRLGLVLDFTVRENTTLAHLERFVRRGFIDRAEETKTTQRFVDELRVRTPSTEQRTRNLSGGNQQKVVLAKWLVDTARVFLFDEPTRGIDVGSKFEIYNLMLALLARGAAIVMVSSELPEVLGMAHRVAVVRGGRIVGELSHADATPDAVMTLAAGSAA